MSTKSATKIKRQSYRKFSEKDSSQKRMIVLGQLKIKPTFLNQCLRYRQKTKLNKIFFLDIEGMSVQQKPLYCAHVNRKRFLLIKKIRYTEKPNESLHKSMCKKLRDTTITTRNATQSWWKAEWKRRRTDEFFRVLCAQQAL